MAINLTVSYEGNVVEEDGRHRHTFVAGAVTEGADENYLPVWTLPAEAVGILSFEMRGYSTRQWEIVNDRPTLDFDGGLLEVSVIDQAGVTEKVSAPINSDLVVGADKGVPPYTYMGPIYAICMNECKKAGGSDALCRQLCIRMDQKGCDALYNRCFRLPKDQATKCLTLHDALCGSLN